MGNRIGKKVTQGGVLQSYTTYALDEQGNPMATYELKMESGTKKMYLSERMIYGSSRLGVESGPSTQLPNGTPLTPTTRYSLSVGDKRYELANHLGNVLNVISDRKIPLKNPANNTVIAFNPNVIQYTDYFPFGMIMPGKNGGSEYRFGFQGQEEDDEIKGDGNSVNYKYRMHDPRIGRFFAVDPLAARYPHNSPYSFSENQVIHCREFEGLEKWELSNNNTYMETFYGPFSSEYIDKQQSKVDHYQNIREKTATILVKVEYEDLSGLTPFPIEPSPFIIHDIPVEINRDDASKSSYATTYPDKIVINGGLGRKDEGFQIAVFAHEYVALYLEGILDLIEDTEGFGCTDIEENPFYNPNKPEIGSNMKSGEVTTVLGTIDWVKEEINGWTLMKSLHDNGLIKLSDEDYKKTTKNIEMYEHRLEQMEDIKIEQDNNKR